MRALCYRNEIRQCWSSVWERLPVIGVPVKRRRSIHFCKSQTHAETKGFLKMKSRFRAVESDIWAEKGAPKWC